MKFQRIRFDVLRVSADNGRQLIARSQLNDTGAMRYMSDASRPVLIYSTAALIQACELVLTDEVVAYMGSQQLKPGSVKHTLAYLITEPRLLELILPAGRRFDQLFVPEGQTRPGKNLGTEIGGPIVALDTPATCGWSAVLTDDSRGPRFSDGFPGGRGWAAGTLFVGISTRELIVPNQLRRAMPTLARV